MFPVPGFLYTSFLRRFFTFALFILALIASQPSETYATTSALPLDFSGVVVLGKKSVKFQPGVEVNSGHVVVNNQSSSSGSGQLDIGVGSVTPAGFALAADQVRIHRRVVVGGNVFFNTLNNQGTINGTQTSPISQFPIFTPLPPFKTGPAGSQNINVASKQTQSLAPGNYRDISLAPNATLNLSPGIYNVRSVSLANGAKLNFQNLSAGVAEVRVAQQFSSASDCFVGPDDNDPTKAGKIVFYVAHHATSGNSAPAATLGRGCTVMANFYAPYGSLDFKQSVHATGAFLAEDVLVGPQTHLSVESFFNQPPVITEGDSITVNMSEDSSPIPFNLTLNATDPDGDTLTWSIKTPASNGTASASGTGNSISAPALNYTPNLNFNGNDSFVVEVSDGKGGTDSITVNVVVEPVNDPPVVNPATFSVDENSPNGTSVGTVIFNDPDAGQMHSFAITAGNTGGAFAINSLTGEITVANGAVLDFETNPSFSLTVEVTDNGVPNLSGSATVTINLNNVNEQPTDILLSNASVAENQPSGTVVGLLSAIDPDLPGDIHSFSLVAGMGGGDNGSFQIVGNELRTAAVLDFETKNSLSVRVRATDSGGLFVEKVFVIGVTDVNEPPVVNPAIFSLNENSPAGTVVGMVTFNDPDAGQMHSFAITAGNTGGAFAVNSATGQITVANSAAVDFETNPVFNLTVGVTDNGVPPLSGSNTITINLIDVNDPPVAQDKNYTAQANMKISIPAASGLLAGATDQDDAAAVLTVGSVSATNPVGGSVNFNGATGAFEFDPPPGATGIVTFTYTVCDDGVPTPPQQCSAPATVTFDVSGPVIWFVNSNLGINGIGTLNDPFNNLASADAVDAANHNVFLFSGIYVTGLPLNMGEKLIGQGVTGTDFDTVFGITPPAGTIARPAINGARPTVQGTVTVNTDSAVRGLDLSTGASTALNDPAGAITGVTVGEVSVATTTGTGINLSDTSGTLTFDSVSSNGAAHGIRLENTSGSFTVSGDGGMAQNGSGGIIQNTTDDCVRLTNTQNVTLRQMNLHNCGNTPAPNIATAQSTAGEHAIEISGGNNIELIALNINNPAASGLLMLNTQGTNRVYHSLFTNLAAGNHHGVYVNNVDANMTLFEFTNNTMNNSLNDASMFFFANSGTSNMNLVVKGSTFDNLANQAATISGGGTAATTGTLTSTIGGPNPADRNFFINANGTGENNLAVLVALGATHNTTVENNVFDDIARDGSIANTSILRTQNSGGVMNATVKDNVIQNITYAMGGRHAIGHVFEPVAFNAGNSSTLDFDGNTINNISYTLSSREAIFVDFRATASGGNVKVRNNNFTLNNGMPGQQAIELRFRQTNASTVNLLVDGNSGTASVTGNSYLDVDAEQSSAVNATITNNTFNNPNAAPSTTIDMETEAAGAAACLNISANMLNNLSIGGGTNNGSIRIAESAGTFNVTQASAVAVASANGIPGANVTVSGSPAFNQPACPTPP